MDHPYAWQTRFTPEQQDLALQYRDRERLPDDFLHAIHHTGFTQGRGWTVEARKFLKRIANDS